MRIKGKISRNYIPYEPNQQYLLPPDMGSWLPANHLVYFLLQLLQHMDLSVFDRTPTSRRGRPSYHYQMLCGLLLYAYSQGVTSSRTIERKTIEEIPYRILAGNQHPDHNTIANFRKNYLSELSSISTSLLLKLQQAGYIPLDLVSVDGTKVKANASIYENMTQENAMKRKEQIEQWIKQKMKEADQQDQEEDDQFGSQNPFLGLPSGKNANKTIDELTKEVNKLDQFLEKTEKEQNQPKEEEQPEKQTKRQKAICPLSPHEKLPPLDYVSNRTDPTSRIMLSGSNHAWVQAFNVELAVDQQNQFVVGVAVSQDCNDQGQLIPMVQQVEKQFKQAPKQLLADAGYCSEKNLTYLLQKQIDGFVATGRPEWLHHDQKEKVESITTDSSSSSLKENGYTHRLGFSLVENMGLKLKTEQGKETYQKRGNLSESSFGFIRHILKFNQFSLRGLQNVQGEANLLILAYNLRKYYRICHPMVVKPRKKNSLSLVMG